MATTIDPTDSRPAKALEVLVGARGWFKCRTRDGAKKYGVPSQRDPNHVYLVDCHSCTCQDFQRRQHPCKHVLACQLFVAHIRAQSVAANARRYDDIFRRFEGD